MPPTLRRALMRTIVVRGAEASMKGSQAGRVIPGPVPRGLRPRGLSTRRERGPGVGRVTGEPAWLRDVESPDPQRLRGSVDGLVEHGLVEQHRGAALDE